MRFLRGGPNWTGFGREYRMDTEDADLGVEDDYVYL